MATCHPLNADGVVFTLGMHGKRAAAYPRAAKTEARYLGAPVFPFTRTPTTNSAHRSVRSAESIRGVRCPRISGAVSRPVDFRSNTQSSYAICQRSHPVVERRQNAYRNLGRQDVSVFPSQKARLLCLVRLQRPRIPGEHR